MSFFFPEAIGQSSKKKVMPIQTAKELGCRVCPLNKEAKNPNISPSGNENADVYFLGRAPDGTDDKKKEFFMGEAGELLRKNIPAAWRDLVRFNNIVRSHPLRNREPTEIEIACCSNSIIADIEQTKPKVIVAVGKQALGWLLSIPAKENDLFKWRGRWVPIKVGKHICWMFPIYHPDNVFLKQKRSRAGNILQTEWDHIFSFDLKTFFEQVKSKIRIKPTYVEDNYLNEVSWTEGLKSDKQLKKVLEELENFSKDEINAIDYETSCLRPMEKDSMLLTMAIANDKKSFAFPIEYPGAWNEYQLIELKKALLKYFKTPVKKICHNSKFEMEWTGHRFGTDLIITDTWEDTQAQAYILDERRGMLNLDTQIRIHFGFYLKDLSNLDRTKMASYPLDKILPYNGLDSKWTYQLFLLQEEIIAKEPKLQFSYERLMFTVSSLARTQLRGVLLDHNNHAELMKEAKDQLEDIEATIQKLKETHAFKDRFGITFNPGSPDHVLKCLKDILDLNDLLKKDDGKYSTDETILSKLDDVELAKHILDYRGINKKISTYLEPYPNYILADGRIHTNFNPFETSTGRLCVAKGTMIEVVRDFSKNPLGVPVEEVKPGDLVYTYNDQLQVTIKPVTWSGVTGHKKVLRIHWRGDGNRTSGFLDLTCNHPVRLINGDYIRADELCVNDRVLSLTRTIGGYISSTSPNNHKITKIEWLNDTVDVYDLGVENTHNFIANGICVSNSSSDPNLQNVPSKTGKEIRRMVGAPEGYWMLCSDYGQIEARIIGIASQDEEFCKALWNDYDVHMEWAKNIADEYPKSIGGSQKLNDKAVMKKFRGKVKNKWVFPAFFGSSANSISRDLNIPFDIVNYLLKEFWKTFRGVREWQKWIMKRYDQLGYVETLDGRRRHAPMTMNAALNASIQGFASNLCTDAMSRLDRLGIETIMIIHDDVTSYVPDEKLEESIDIVAREMCRVSFPFVNVPIAVEMTVGPNWFDQVEVGTFKSTDFYKVPKKPLDFTTLYDL